MRRGAGYGFDHLSIPEVWNVYVRYLAAVRDVNRAANLRYGRYAAEVRDASRDYLKDRLENAFGGTLETWENANFPRVRSLPRSPFLIMVSKPENEPARSRLSQAVSDEAMDVLLVRHGMIREGPLFFEQGRRTAMQHAVEFSSDLLALRTLLTPEGNQIYLFASPQQAAPVMEFWTDMLEVRSARRISP